MFFFQFLLDISLLYWIWFPPPSPNLPPPASTCGFFPMHLDMEYGKPDDEMHSLVPNDMKVLFFSLGANVDFFLMRLDL
jgi:hypothetical protein